MHFDDGEILHIFGVSVNKKRNNSPAKLANSTDVVLPFIFPTYISKVPISNKFLSNMWSAEHLILLVSKPLCSPILRQCSLVMTEQLLNPGPTGNTLKCAQVFFSNLKNKTCKRRRTRNFLVYE